MRSLPRDRIQSLVKEIAPEIKRPKLHEILIKSKLVPKMTPFSELRRMYPDPGSWVRFVFESYENRAKERAAERALNLLAREFSQIQTLDQPTKTALSKAAIAAERRNFKGLQRHLEKLKGILQDPLAVVFLLTSSSTGKKYVVDIAESPAEEEVLEESRKTEASAPISDEDDEEPANKVEELKREDERDDSTISKRREKAVPEKDTGAQVYAHASGLDYLCGALKAKKKPEPEIPDWNLDDEAKVLSTNAATLNWPPIEDLTSELRELEDVAASLKDLETPEKHEDIDGVIEWVDQFKSMQGLIEASIASMRSYLGRCKEGAMDYVETVSETNKKDAIDALEKLDDEVAAHEGIKKLCALVQREADLCKQRLEKNIRIAKKIRDESRWIHGEAEDLKIQVVEILRSEGTDKLERLLSEVSSKASAIKMDRKRELDAAEAVLSLIEDGDLGYVSPQITQECLEAVELGDVDRAKSKLLAAAARTQLDIREAKEVTSVGEDSATAAPGHDHETKAGPTETDRTFFFGLPVMLVGSSFKPRNRKSMYQLKEIRSESKAKKSIIDDLAFVESPQEAVNISLDHYSSSENEEERSKALTTFMLWRTVEEMARGSVVGAVDHILDILSFFKDPSDPIFSAWGRAALILLAKTHPQVDNADAKESIRLMRGDHSCSLEEALNELLQKQDSETIIAQRFSYAELKPYSKLIASSFKPLIEGKPYQTEDVARGIANGARYGDPSTSASILIAIGELLISEKIVTKELRKILDRTIDTTQKKREREAAPHSKTPLWLSDAMDEFISAVESRPKQKRAGKQLHTQIPRSVIDSGGFVINEDSRELKLVILVSNHQELSRAALDCELVIPKAGNPGIFLERDLVCSVGAILSGDRVLVTVDLDLEDVVNKDTDSIDIQFDLFWREIDSRETRQSSKRPRVPLSWKKPEPLLDYDGALGQPLILTDEKLNLSSKSVRDTLRKISEQLEKKKVIAALIVGRRRRGKTSILYTLEKSDRVKENYLIKFDRHEALPFESLQSVLTHLGRIFDDVAATLKISMPSAAVEFPNDVYQPWASVQNWLDRATKQLDKDKRVLLLIDEFQKWLSELNEAERSKILLILRGVANRPAESKLSISIVISGLTNIMEYTLVSQDFRNAFQVYNIKAFNIKESEALIRSNKTIEYDTRAIRKVRELSGGNPFLINCIGSMIVGMLEEQNRRYCTSDDIEVVVERELNEPHSRVRNFIQYMLHDGEEDHAPEISELPALVAIALTFSRKGRQRTFVRLEEVVETFKESSIECDKEVLEQHLNACSEAELVEVSRARYKFTSLWLAEWLQVMYKEKLLPIHEAQDPNLVLKRYQITKKLESGGQGQVFEAYDNRRCHGNVILKIYPRQGKSGFSMVAKGEAELLSQLDHDAIVRALEYGEDASKGDVIVLEKGKGESLRSLMQEGMEYCETIIGRSGNMREQVHLLAEIASGLSECHRIGIVHKDIKPENILLHHSSGRWYPKIIDFGLAMKISTEGGLKKTQGPYTLGYVAPERYRGEARRSPSDIYSLGVVAYELLTGKHPFDLDPPSEIPEAQKKEDFKKPKDLRNDMPEALSELISRMLSADTGSRPTSAALSEELEAVFEKQDWTELSKEAVRVYEEADPEGALEIYERAAFSAPVAERSSRKYIEMMDIAVDAAIDCSSILATAEKFASLILKTALSGSPMSIKAERIVTKIVTKLIESVDTSASKRGEAVTVLESVFAQLSGSQPSKNLIPLVQYLLTKRATPVLDEFTERLYLLGLHYVLGNVADTDLLISFCVANGQSARMAGNLTDCQLWLNRATWLDGGETTDYKAEAEKLKRLLRKTATPILLPRNADRSKWKNTIGKREAGHLKAEKIDLWAERIRTLYPFVQEVRRVRKKAKIDQYPTRIRALDKLGMHKNAAKGIEPERIIPAVLDASYSRGSEVPLLINIILPEGTNSQQRQAAIDVLKNGEMFG